MINNQYFSRLTGLGCLHKREAVNAIVNAESKTVSANSSLSNVPAELPLLPSYHNKVNLISVLYAEKVDGGSPVDNRPSTNYKLHHLNFVL